MRSTPRIKVVALFLLCNASNAVAGPNDASTWVDILNPTGKETKYEVIPFQCTDTEVKVVTTRLTDGKNPIPGSGTAVRFQDGTSVVSYETILIAEKQREGDKVQVCLLTQPANCPAGDDRGKLYRIYDYRQRDAYVASNSQHECGGA